MQEMQDFGLVELSTGEVLRYESFAAAPEQAASKGRKWLLVSDTKPSPEAGQKLEGPVVTVGADAITRVWTSVPDLAPVPRSVSAFQARAILHRGGLLEQLEAIIAASNDQEAKLAWEYAVEFVRDGALLNGVAGQLGLSGAQIDDLFRAAALIEA